MKKKIRIIIDISMTVTMPLLMAYSLIGELFHEITGSLIFILFIIHHILNRRWYGTIAKGKYNAKRIFQTILNLFLLVFMILPLELKACSTDTVDTGGANSSLAITKKTVNNPSYRFLTCFILL